MKQSELVEDGSDRQSLKFAEKRNEPERQGQGQRWQCISPRFYRLSGQAFAPYVRRLSLAFPSGFRPSNLQLPEHQLVWSPLASFSQDWKLRSLHRQHSEPTWKQPQQSNVQMWSRWDCVHFFGTTDLLLILNQVRAHIVLSRKKNGKISTKPTKQLVRDTRASVRWCDKEGTLTGKQKLKMKRFPKGVRSDKTRVSKSLTSSQLKLHRFWMARAPFDLRRSTRGFIPILQAALTLWILWCLIASDQVRLHLSITPCTVARDRTGWCSHTHHVVWPLGFTFPKLTPGPCANSNL